MQNYSMFAPTRVLFGIGSLSMLGKQKLPGKKALLVISCGKSVRENGYLRRTEEELVDAGVQWIVFDEVQANPLKDTVMRGAETAKKCNCDFVVALGGGSVMDGYLITLLTLIGSALDNVISHKPASRLALLVTRSKIATLGYVHAVLSGFPIATSGDVPSSPKVTRTEASPPIQSAVGYVHANVLELTMPPIRSIARCPEWEWSYTYTPKYK